jgi:preprotein translocase subunit YajC
MDEETFNNLKVGDRVVCNYGSEATVIKIGAKDVHTKRKMVVLDCDKKKWSCPFFYRYELKGMA